jgi:hypothetical protein
LARWKQLRQCLLCDGHLLGLGLGAGLLGARLLLSLIAKFFQNIAYTRPMEDLRENCPFESFGRIPGKQRQAISVSSLLLSLF